MPFIAECPYCKKGKLQCSDKAVGWSATCPNPECGLSFTIVRSQAPLPAARSGPRMRSRKPEAPKSAASPVETLPSRASPIPRVETPVPTNAPRELPPPIERVEAKPPPPPAPAEESPHLELEDGPASRRWQMNPCTMLSFFLAGIGLVLAAVIYSLDAVPMMVSGLALLLGIVGVFMAKREGTSPKLAAVGPAVAALSILGLFFFPSLLNPSRALRGEAKLIETKERQVIPQRPKPSFGSGAAAPVTTDTMPDWVDASKDVAQFGDVWLRVKSVSVEHVELTVRGQKQQSQEKWLVIRLEAANNGIQRRIDYESWAQTSTSHSKHRTILSDGSGKTLEQHTFSGDAKPTGQLSKGFMMPGKSLEDVLVFERPTNSPSPMHLEMSLSAFGQEGTARWEIPRSMILLK